MNRHPQTHGSRQRRHRAVICLVELMEQLQRLNHLPHTTLHLREMVLLSNTPGKDLLCQINTPIEYNQILRQIVE